MNHSIYFKYYIVPVTILGLLFTVLSFYYADEFSKIDNADKSTLNISTYLIGHGINSVLSVIIVLLLFLFYASIDRNNDLEIKIPLYNPLGIIFTIIGLFSISWIIVGAIIIFNKDIQSIETPSGIYAVFIWSYIVAHLFYNQCINQYIKAVYELNYIKMTISIGYIKRYILSNTIGSNQSTFQINGIP